MKLINLYREKTMKILAIGLVLFALVSCGGPSSVSITIQPDGNNMAYLTKEFTVKAGQEVVLTMDNTATQEVMKHNIVILSDKSKVNEIGMAALKAENYLPDHPAIIAATAMADAGAKSEVTFTAPSEPGEYTYICTYPGHYAMMQGVMIVK
tara:strand:+ start:2446 stop:2901 length:456 start_codon:yes stop_codon:yes gene_type:complete